MSSSVEWSGKVQSKEAMCNFYQADKVCDSLHELENVFIAGNETKKNSTSYQLQASKFFKRIHRFMHKVKNKF